MIECPPYLVRALKHHREMLDYRKRMSFYENVVNNIKLLYSINVIKFVKYITDIIL